MIQQRRDGMYAMCIDDQLSTQVLGGPFTDIDDVLDACFDSMMAKDRDASTMFYVQVEGSNTVVRAFPRGAFPFAGAPLAD